ncbi:DUF413 domain-containing protein [Vibrio natriegens]|uniref:DUF413 domain-containing protein n=1 Tax=Vibrio natriegens TaxID=691 RepID=UPI003557451D
MASKEHMEYRKLTFKPNVPEALFSSEEQKILSTYGSWFAALMRGDIVPETEEQERFVKASLGQIEPTSEYEKLWVRYLKRKIWENHNPDYVGKENKDLLLNLGISNGRWGLHGRFK